MLGLWTRPANAGEINGVGGKKLAAQVAACPSKNLLNTQAIPAIAGGIIASTASNLAGYAVDAIADYLTKDRASTSEATLPLDAKQVSGLFGGDQCLYIYLNTPKLSGYLNSMKIFWSDAESSLTELANAVKSQDLTSFFVTMRFVSATADNASSPTSGYFRPEVFFWHYNKFLNSRCLLFLSCSKRDILTKIEISYPRNASEEASSIKALPLAVGIASTTPTGAAAALSQPSSLFWFTLNTSAPLIGNLRYSITETSKPGALARAIGNALRSNKDQIQREAQRIVYISPSEKTSLQQTAVDEYQKYAAFYTTATAAKEAYLNDRGIDKLNTYYAARAQTQTQLEIARKAWISAGIYPVFKELGTLPVSP